MSNFKKTARIASQQDFSEWRNNKESMKAQGLRLTRVSGNWVLMNINEVVSEAFWKAWRTRKAELKAKGYRVGFAFGMYITY